MPSSTNPGEVSYVLIVEQSSDADKDDTVYDFNEPDEGLSYVSACVGAVLEVLLEENIFLLCHIPVYHSVHMLCFLLGASQ